jgi:hypothetical protein
MDDCAREGMPAIKSPLVAVLLINFRLNIPLFFR